MRTKLEMLEGYLADQSEEPLIELKVKWLKELVAEIKQRSLTDSRKAGVRYWFDEVFRKLKSKKAKDVVKEALGEHPEWDGCMGMIKLEAQCTLPVGHKGDCDYETPREITHG